MVLLSDCKSGTDEHVTKFRQGKVELTGNGIGPIGGLIFDPEIDFTMADLGKGIFELKCNKCHKVGEKYIGPSLNGIYERRSPTWVMNMIMNPEEMTQKDSVANALFNEYKTHMITQKVSIREVRAISEYLRTLK